MALSVSTYFTVSTLLDLWQWNIGQIISPKNDPTYNKIGKLIMLAIGNARIHFSKEALRTPEYFGKDDAPLKERFEALNGFIEAFITKTKMEGLAERIQKWIVDLPLKNHEPKVTNVTTSYAKHDWEKGMLIQVHGNFIYATDPRFRPSLTYCGKIYHSYFSTNLLDFRVDERPGTTEKTYEPVMLTVPYETGYVPALKSTQASETFRWQQAVIPETGGTVTIFYKPVARHAEKAIISRVLLYTDQTPPLGRQESWLNQPKNSFTRTTDITQIDSWETQPNGWIKYTIDLQTGYKRILGSIQIADLKYTFPPSEEMTTCQSHFKPPQIVFSSGLSVKVQLEINPSITRYMMDFNVGFFMNRTDAPVAVREESPFDQRTPLMLKWKDRPTRFSTHDRKIEKIEFTGFDGSAHESSTESTKKITHPFLIQELKPGAIEFRCWPNQLENYE